MKTSSLRYLIKEGARNIWSNRIMSFTSMGVLTTCLLLVGAAYLITVNVNSMVRYVEDQNEMSVFLAEGIEKAEVSSIQKQISNLRNVVKVDYISKEEGLENMKESFGEDAYLIDDLKDRNPIPETFVVKVEDISLTARTKSDLEAIPGIEDVRASSAVADTMTRLQQIVGTFGSAIILALGIISLVIISNTIRATIFTRRKEINIMKFVGATNSFIRIPFVVEGFLLGLFSASIAFLIIWGSYHYLVDSLKTGASAFLNEVFQSIIPFDELALSLGVFFGITGTVLGMFGSLISMRKHIKV